MVIDRLKYFSSEKYLPSLSILLRIAKQCENRQWGIHQGSYA
jgi:hypothetical protein